MNPAKTSGFSVGAPFSEVFWRQNWLIRLRLRSFQFCWVVVFHCFPLLPAEPSSNSPTTESINLASQCLHTPPDKLPLGVQQPGCRFTQLRSLRSALRILPIVHQEPHRISNSPHVLWVTSASQHCSASYNISVS